MLHDDPTDVTPIDKIRRHNGSFRVERDNKADLYEGNTVKILMSDA